jgi:uncharacterized protein (DUF983 family)
MKWCATKGADYTCPHCGAQYETEYRHYTTKERDAADCVVCGKEMNWWNSASVPTYLLKKYGRASHSERKRDATHGPN